MGILPLDVVNSRSITTVQSYQVMTVSAISLGLIIRSNTYEQPNEESNDSNKQKHPQRL